MYSSYSTLLFNVNVLLVFHSCSITHHFHVCSQFNTFVFQSLFCNLYSYQSWPIGLQSCCLSYAVSNTNCCQIYSIYFNTMDDFIMDDCFLCESECERRAYDNLKVIINSNIPVQEYVYVNYVLLLWIIT